MDRLLGVILLCLVTFGSSVAGPTTYYVICTDEDGKILQFNGDKIEVVGDTVLVYDEGTVINLIVGIKCWTADETTVLTTGNDDD